MVSLEVSAKWVRTLSNSSEFIAYVGFLRALSIETSPKLKLERKNLLRVPP